MLPTKRALQERPVGIVPTNEHIKLTKDSRYYLFPLTGEETHPKGYYKPQTVQAFEKWRAEDGWVFYRIHGNGVDEWVVHSRILP